MILALGSEASGDDPATLIVAIAAVLISLASLGVAIVSLKRSPQVLWVTDLDEISADDEFGLDRSPYIWRMEHANRGRAMATSVRWRFIDRQGSKSSWSAYRNVAQGENVSFSAGLDANDLRDLSNPMKPKNRGPAYELQWRGARDVKRAHTKLLYPTEQTTITND